MKQLRYLIFFVASLVLSAAFYSCEDEDKNGGNSNEPVIYQVYLEDANSTIPDRKVEYARLSQTIRIEGENFVGLTKVFINGYDCYFNPVFITNTSMIIQIDKNVPVIPEGGGEIRLEKGGKFTLYTFDIRAAAPSITAISHTLPLAGEWITISGSGLVGVTKVRFPGNIEINTETAPGDIVDGIDGKYFSVKVPEGMPDEGGAIYIECTNGGAYSPAFFNCKTSVFLNFDGRGEQGVWGSATTLDDLLSEVIGEGNISQGNYCPLIPERMAPIASSTSRATEVWTSGNENWREMYISTGLIASNALASDVAFQFDIYVPEEWNNTGFIGVNLANNFNAENQWTGEFYNYIPWLVDGKKADYKTTGWTTVSIPLNEFYKFSEGSATFEDILAFRDKASNKNAGLFFNNNNFTLKDITKKDADESVVFESSETSVKAYVDNFRVVSLVAPAYSDYPDEEAEE